MGNSRAADQNIHIANGFKGFLHSGAVGNIAADGRCAGLFRHGLRRFMAAAVEEEHPVPSGGEHLHRSGADAPGAAGDHYS